MAYGEYKNKKVLVTGHTGFCGSWLSLWLQSLGAEVYGISKRPNTNPNLFELFGIFDEERSSIGDISDPDYVKNICQKIEPDIIFHLAAQPLVRQSYFDTVETYRSNVMGTVEVLEAVRHTPTIKQAVLITTDKVYDNVEWVYPYRENDKLGGKDPYSASKSACEFVIESYKNTILGDDKKIAVARGGNIIGGGDWSKNRLIPDIVRSYNSQDDLELRNPDATRPWQHVLDLCNGYLLLGHKMMLGHSGVDEAWNFGPIDGSNMSTVEILTRFQEHLDVNYIVKKTDNLAESSQLALDCSKAKKRLNWHPVWNTEEAIKNTAEWYKAYYDGSDMRVFSKTQLSEYQAKI